MQEIVCFCNTQLNTKLGKPYFPKKPQTTKPETGQNALTWTCVFVDVTP